MTGAKLTSSRGTLVFGSGPFVLHRLLLGTPALSDGVVGQRSVEIAGYILPEGANAAARAAVLERARRLVCRIASAEEGFSLHIRGGRTLRLTCERGPEFAGEAPLNGTDAAFFTLHAVSAAEDGCLSGEALTASARGHSGALIFPLSITAGTIFGTLSRSGTLTAENPGDAQAGFTLTVTAEGGTLTAFSVSLGERFLAVSHTLAEGESLCIDTRPGQKDVTAAAGSVLGETDWRSEFFALPPGESTLSWACEGTGHAALRLTLTPRYL